MSSIMASATKIIFKAFFLTIIISVRPGVLSATMSNNDGLKLTSFAPLESSNLSTYLATIRGGGSSEVSLVKDFTKSNFNKTVSGGEDYENDQEGSSKIGSPSYSLPFRLITEVREEATTLAQADVNSQYPNRRSDCEEDAAVLAKEVDDLKTNLANSPVGFDSSRVAPLSSRLIENDLDVEAEKEEVALDQQKVPQVVTDASKLWWVNLWTQVSNVDATSNSSEGHRNNTKPSISTEGHRNITEQDSIPNPYEDAVIDSEAYDEDIMDEIELKGNMTDTAGNEIDTVIQQELQPGSQQSTFVSSGMWVRIDNFVSFGLSKGHPNLRLSKGLRPIRKLSARITGLHGLLSGKPAPTGSTKESRYNSKQPTTESFEENDTLQTNPSNISISNERPEAPKKRNFPIFGTRERFGEKSVDGEDKAALHQSISEEEMTQKLKQEQDELEEEIRMERVKEIDRLIAAGQERLQHLICEKDVLQRRPNPLFDYTSEKAEVESRKPSDDDQENDHVRIQASRKFNFPPDDLVEEYLDMILSSHRLSRMNHSKLWQDSDIGDEDEESIGDDLLNPSVDAHKLYQGYESRSRNSKQPKSRGKGGGSWLLRQTIGKGPSIGEKLGEIAETAAYKSVCAAVMSFLARSLSSLHGINVMTHSDIRLVLEQAPDLPRVGEGVIPGSSSDYAEKTIKTVIRRKTKKNRKRTKHQLSDDPFVQRDAVTEMLLSHVQISAPLLKLFPLAWQRAFLGNIITLSTAVMSDFFDGLQFQILGHSLTFAFVPITEEDMINHIGLSGMGYNRRRAKAEEFETAVQATAKDLEEQLKFLDRWHERALGSGVLRTQIAHLIARIVLTLTDEVLSGARMDLWSASAGGPRMLAGLEYRNQSF